MSLTSKLLAITMAAILLLFGIPNFLAAVWMAVGGETINGMIEGAATTPQQIEEAIETRHAALSLAPRAKASADLAYLYQTKGPTVENYQLAIAALEESLRQEPVSAYRWLALSSLFASFPDKQEQAITAWRTSRALSVYDHLLWHQRIAVGVRLYEYFSEEDQAALTEDMELAYRYNRFQFRQFAKQRNLLEWTKFLLKDPEKTAFLSR